MTTTYKLSAYRASPGAQATFWPDDRRIANMAQTRNMAGEFFEAATAALVVARRHRTDSAADVCPDASTPAGDYFESKSVGKTGSVIVYDARLAKDLAWTAAHRARLFYCIWHHRADCLAHGLRSDLWVALAAAAVECIVLPLADLAALCPEDAKRLINNGGRAGAKKTFGYGSPGYKYGWMIPLRTIRERCGVVAPAREVVAEGIPLRVPILCPPGAADVVPTCGGVP